ncbi:hypothetical protein C4M98_01770 [Mycoplasmopsis pullorum]|uniref:histidine triad protein HinT n=1 Tax=Mycoplasmopsis pullorum TaxID=48003 RepID=UPI00111825C1|nr:HIT domain-containing protein [Mycoplasmopsis pullorum]TNK82074.1 hypothetical protein C4M94_02105 [Mycoplasmopsis pullorum]TNK82777.1 hypothetical protein C4M80_02380 [Mycoplasmopsis pullorum]TNK84265.1 hypothetical protein C4M81_02795 [Mycoplasmopsis pullorum]TNK85254.1 hypothetical protein C4M92_01975 [Mycoplasmopsis pullorum]TNK85655.1 hypothetical protein C4M85_02665 [Mycoplasmopsis pullorum]
MKDIFLKIINREIPAKIIYEDDKVIAFMDAYPIQEGHFLVVPKNWAPNVLESSDEDITHAFLVARKLAKERVINQGIPAFKIVINTGKEAEQSVFHTHIHVIPYK